MVTGIAGYRLRPVGMTPGFPSRMIGTRERDGVRVAVVLDALGGSAAAGEGSGVSGYPTPDGRDTTAGAAVPGVLPVGEVLHLGDAVAVVYVDPPRHTLAELAALGPLPADAIAYAVVRVARVLTSLRELGIPHPGVTAEAVWVTATGDLIVGDLGRPAGPLDPDLPVRSALDLAGELLGDLGAATPGVARLGLDREAA
ncbi:MAG: hypothetical protein WBP28_10895, partial [Nostocoides sp.]